MLREGRELPARLLAQGEEPIPLEDGKTVRGRVDAAEGGAAGAAGLQAAAGPSLAATVQARRRERGGQRMKPRAPADALWICERVPRTGARPSGRVDSRWTTRSPESRSTGRSAAALPTGCPHSRASRPQPHSSATKFFFSKKRKARTAKRGHFCFGEKARCDLSHPRSGSCARHEPAPPVLSKTHGLAAYFHAAVVRSSVLYARIAPAATEILRTNTLRCCWWAMAKTCFRRLALTASRVRYV